MRIMRWSVNILPVMASKPNICKYLDIPVQHISDNVLKIMRRGITKRRTYQVLNTIKAQVPNIALRTTILVGHPGETDQDFEELKQFVIDFQFDRLGVFTYSHEENTHAHTLVDDIPADVKQKRAEELMALQEEISLKKNKAKVGTTIKVLFDRKEGEYFIGRTEADSPEVDNEVLVSAKNNFVRVGDFAQVKIIEAESFDLIAQLV